MFNQKQKKDDEDTVLGSSPEYLYGSVLKPLEDYKEEDMKRDTWPALITSEQCFAVIKHDDTREEFFNELDARSDKDEFIEKMKEIDDEFTEEWLVNKDVDMADSYYYSFNERQRKDFFILIFDYFRPFIFKHRVFASKLCEKTELIKVF